jgi:hypothetical protein
MLKVLVASIAGLFVGLLGIHYATTATTPASESATAIVAVDRPPDEQVDAQMPALVRDVEQFFAKLKALLRRAAARTIDALIAVIADALTKISPQECANYLANQGYRHNS